MASFNLKGDLVEQGGAAESPTDVLQADQRHCDSRLIQFKFGESAVYAGISHRFFPSCFKADMFEHFPVAEIKIGLGAFTVVFQEITQAFIKCAQIVVRLQPDAVRRIT